MIRKILDDSEKTRGVYKNICTFFFCIYFFIFKFNFAALSSWIEKNICLNINFSDCWIKLTWKQANLIPFF